MNKRIISQAKHSGFTIVELLIVIVVIGVLAAITIVAYNGIQKRAQGSAASSALSQAAKKLTLYQVDAGSYPSSLATAGVTDGGSVSYQYSQNNSGLGYCVTATSGSVSYKITESTQPAAGACPGDTQDGFVATSCLSILNGGYSTGDGYYRIKPPASPSDFIAYCDMTTDGGGWTIATAQNGAGQYGLTSDTEVSGNPLSYQPYNLNLLKKEYISAVSTESLFKRSNGTWIEASHALFDDNLTGAGNQHPHWQVTVTANNGASAANSQMGYSNFNNSGGGDYAITTGGTTLDHHGANYYHLNGGCASSYFYQYGSAYNVNSALGSWLISVGCASNSANMGGWYAANR